MTSNLNKVCALLVCAALIPVVLVGLVVGLVITGLLVGYKLGTDAFISWVQQA